MTRDADMPTPIRDESQPLHYSCSGCHSALVYDFWSDHFERANCGLVHSCLDDIEKLVAERRAKQLKVKKKNDVRRI
jgi:hypothetical protein